ncbi:hypothetical protein [Cellulomonas sp. C5510]|uniref:hypothetical protein n=1 Tax=Cellulomonas sp. C5510 TaxID=2871170 RepID=UPI001C950E2A|nr:hypothetical protein [Cellulomonas sp. C5510]QZN85036.1 hypothetical protein K5O09_14725 [Cellulomonas sp. C5510]
MTAPHARTPAVGPSGRQAHADAVPPRRSVRRRLAAVSALLLAAAAGGTLAGCSSPAADAVRSSAVASPPSTTDVARAPDCLAPQVLLALGFAADAYDGAPHPDVPDPAPLPDGFTVASAVLCSTGETLTDAAGRWAAVTATRLEGDVGPLVTALAAPVAAAASDPGPDRCSRGAARSDLWLVDALGSAVRVPLPRSGCDPLPRAVRDGLAALDVVDVERYPVALVAPSAAASPGG